MFGSNFPLDKLFVRYPDMAAVYRASVSDLSASEMHRLFYGTAAEFYRI
jgi:predicted TIM-barrel fold metal-dependent hydrolase